MLRYSDLPADMQRLADVAGLDVVARVIVEFAGERIDITGRKGLRPAVTRYVREHQATCTAAEMAGALGLSQRYVETILSEIRRQQQSPAAAGNGGNRV